MSQEPPSAPPKYGAVLDCEPFHGRWYGKWRPGKYLFPVDDQELYRMDVINKFFLVARNDEPCSITPNKHLPIKILDLGTGTGIWAIDVAENYYPKSTVMAVDLETIQPRSIPPNFETKQLDIEDPSWDDLPRNYDLVHMRLLLGSIQTNLWGQVYRNAFEHLAPGGILEHVEIDWTPHWEPESKLPEGEPVLKEWCEKFLDAMDKAHRNARTSAHDAKRLMEAAGLTDFKEESIKCYVNPGSNGNDLGRWLNLCLHLGVDAMSLKPMIEHLRMTEADVLKLCDRVRQEICILAIEGFLHIRVWTAKRAS